MWNPLDMRAFASFALTVLMSLPSTPGAAASVPVEGTQQEKTVIAEGEKGGHSWRLVGYRQDGALCVDLEIGTDSFGGCGRRAEGHLRVGSVGWTNQLPRWAIVHGQVSSAVAKLRARHYDGRIHGVRLWHSERFSRTFFVVFLEEGRRAQLTARSGSSELLARHRFSRDDLDFVP